MGKRTCACDACGAPEIHAPGEAAPTEHRALVDLPGLGRRAFTISVKSDDPAEELCSACRRAAVALAVAADVEAAWARMAAAELLGRKAAAGEVTMLESFRKGNEGC